MSGDKAADRDRAAAPALGGGSFDRFNAGDAVETAMDLAEMGGLACMLGFDPLGLFHGIFGFGAKRICARSRA